MLEIKHDLECPAFRKDECFCACGATEQALRARVEELEHEVHAWRFRFPDLAYSNRIDGVQPK